MGKMPLDKEALREACNEVVKSTLWQTSEPIDLSDIVDTNQREQTAKAYFEIALTHTEFIEEQNRDPNLITRAVRYLAYVHAIPPYKDDIGWFKEKLETLIELACPNIIHTRESTEFFKDIEQGMKVALDD